MGTVWGWITGGATWLLNKLAEMFPGIVAKVLAAFGLTMISIKGVLPELKTFIMGFASGLPAQALEFLSAIGVGIAMSMILSALMVRMATKIFFVPTEVATALKAGGIG